MLHLEHGNLRLSVDPELGGGIADWSIKGPGNVYFPIMRRAMPGETSASRLGSFFMAPWCNRIAGASFEFGGIKRQLKPTTADGMAQHGDVRGRAWKVFAHDQQSVALEFDSRLVSVGKDVNWPWKFACKARYELRVGKEQGAGELVIDLSVQNVDSEPFPAGCGHHPYFARRLWDDRDELMVKVPVRGQYPLERGCAIGAAQDNDACTRLRELGRVQTGSLDGVFTASGAEEPAELVWPSSGVKVRILPDEKMGHWVVYMPHVEAGRESPLSFVAVEPQTQVNGALNLLGRPEIQGGTRVLGPGEVLHTRVVIQVERG